MEKEEEEFKKVHENLDKEAISHKMAGLMVTMIKSKGDDGQVEAFQHVMANFTKEEMAFVVTVHGAMSIEQAIKQTPELEGMIGAIQMIQDMEDKITKDE